MIQPTIEALVADRQNPKAVEGLLPKLLELLTHDEVIIYVGVQKKLFVTVSAHAVVITNKRYLALRPSLFGFTFEDIPWRQVADVHLSEQWLGATLTCTALDGRVTAVDWIPKKQARRIYTYAQEVEEQAHRLRREAELERLRAGAGQVLVQANTHVDAPASPESTEPTRRETDPLQALAQVKRLLDAGLITPAEFEAKKAEILQRL